MMILKLVVIGSPEPINRKLRWQEVNGFQYFLSTEITQNLKNSIADFSLLPHIKAELTTSK